MNAAVVHLDADAFFASVEQAADPRLRGKPIAVGGEKRGIIASASYEARQFGIYTPMPTVQAKRLCPKLILLPGDFEKYELFSRLMFSYAYDFTPDVEIGSIDEGYFDLTGARQTAVGIAQTIRQAIRQALKLSVSEGIASNKLVSQIASKLKKPAAFQWVPPGEEARFLSPLANKWLPGIGPKTARQLNAAGLACIGQIAKTPAEMLGLLLGRQAPQMRSFALGIDERPVVPMRAPAKSYGEQETFAADTTDEPFIEATLRRMADKLMAKAREDGKSIRTLTVKVRYNDMDEEQTSESLPEPTDLEVEVYSKVSALLKRAWNRRVSLRLVSLKLSNVYEGRFGGGLALDNTARLHQAQQRLADVVDGLRQKYGRGAVLRGHDLLLNLNHSLNRNLNQESGFRVQGPDASERRERGAWSVERESIRPIGPISPRSTLSRSHAPTLPRSSYVPLNVHSHYSFLDSTLSLQAIVELAKRHELPAIALTDSGNLHGAVEFTQAATRAGIKPILGVELRIADGKRLFLYVESAQGYFNLCRLLTRHAQQTLHAPSETSSNRSRRRQRARDLSESAPTSFAKRSAPTDVGGYTGHDSYDAPVATRQRWPLRLELLDGLTDGLIALSEDPSLAELFPDRFYLKATRPSATASASEDHVSRFTHHASRITHHVVSPPIHYATPDDRLKYDILQSIRTLTLLRQAHPEKRSGGRYHFRTPAEMAALCKEHPDWLRNTSEIAERCHFVMPFGKPQFPPYPPPDGSTPSDFLRRLVFEGLRQHYGPRASQYQAQVMEELAIISEVGYEEYFLITWDFLQDCKQRGIEWITRGSAADSLVCYCLGISGVCPIRFNLYFRRFLNKERMALHKLPDIDIDFAHDEKDDVVKLILDKYGTDHCAMVGGFSTFQARSAFAEVAKVLGVAEREVRKFTDHFPWSFGGGWIPDEHTPSGGAGLIELLRASPENQDLPFDEEPYRTALETAEFLDGMPRYPKMHPCGLVLSRQPMHELTPTFISNKGLRTAHFDMDAVEEIGLVKMDILAQGGLAVMRDVTAMLGRPDLNPSSKVQNRQSLHASRITHLSRQSGAAAGHILPPPARNSPASPERNRGGKLETRNPIDLDALEPWTDPAVWELIASGNARAVHHIESPAMTSLCRQCNVREIDGLIAIVSVIRPGAANEGKKLAFTRRYQGLEPVTFPHPSLKTCLRSTYGLVVYEEHILQICEAFAGLSPGRADVLRRALNKQRRTVVQEIRGEFFTSALACGHSPEKIAEVWDLVAGFAGYAFCKAHSTAYGVEAYQAAWLKLHYPAEFMAAVLTNGKGFYDPLVYVLECYRLGIPLLPPSVNEPGPGFSVQYSVFSIRYPSSCVKSTTEDRGFRVQGSGFSVQGSRLSSTDHGSRITDHGSCITPAAIRVPLTRMKGLSTRTADAILAAREHGPFASMADFFHRVAPAAEELEAMIRAGAFDEFGQSRTRQFWQAQHLLKTFGSGSQSRRSPAPNAIETATHISASRNVTEPLNTSINSINPINSSLSQPWLLAPPALEQFPDVRLNEPTRLERLQWEADLFGYPVSGHPLELYPDIAWDTYCPIARLGEHVGRQIVTCGLVVEQRVHHQITGEPMKFLTMADWTGMVETELFAKTYRSYGLNTVRYRVLEIAAKVEPFDNGNGFTLRVIRARKPRTKGAHEA